jgi:hypothetical protein
MKAILKSAITMMFALSIGHSAFAAKALEIKTEEVKKFRDLVTELGIEGVRLEGLDSLVQIRPELKSSFGNMVEQMRSKPKFFKENKEAVKTLISSINGATGMAAQVSRKISDGSLTFKNEAAKAKAEKVVQACEALPGALFTIVTGAKGDIARLNRVGAILAKISEKRLTTESSEANILAKSLEGTEANPKTVDDLILLAEKAMNDNRTDGKKFTFEDLIKNCLEAMRKA